MKKILFVFHDSNPLSGATASLLDLISGFINIGDIEVIALIPNTNKGLIEVLLKKNIKCYEERYFSSRYPVNSNSAIRTYEWGKSIIKTILTFIFACKFSLSNVDFDVVYSNTSDVYMGSFISIFKRKKHIWHIREFGLEDQNRKHCFSDYFFKKYLGYTSTYIIFISYALEKKFQIKNHKNHSVIYNDIFCNRLPYDKSYNLDSKNKLSLLIVGSLSIGKGQKEVIDIVKQLKNKNIDVYLGIAGDDLNAYGRALKKHVEALHLNENINFLGFCNKVHEIRKDYDIAVIPSISEAFGRVTIEAMYSNMLVIAKNTGANIELIESGVNGYLYEDSRSFIEIIKYLNSNREVIKEVTSVARRQSKKYMQGNASQTINRIINKNL